MFGMERVKHAISTLMSTMTLTSGAQNLKMDHVTQITPLWGYFVMYFVIPRLTFDIAYPCTKFYNFSFSRSRDMIGASKI